MQRKNGQGKAVANRRRCLGSTIGLLVFAIIVGCRSGGTIAVVGSEEQVKQVVTSALEAWKSGATLADFTASHPELVVADEDWQAGAGLVGFKMIEPATANGSHWRQKVELQTKVKNKAKPTVVYYAVTLGEKTSILRSDFQY